MANANTYAGQTLTTVATAWLAPKTRKAAGEYILAKAQTSKRKRWQNAAKAVTAGDELRMRAYAATGDDAKAAWADVRKADAPVEAKPQPKAKTTTKRKTPARKTAQPKAANDLQGMVDAIAGLDDAAMAAFTAALLDARSRAKK